MKEQYTGRESLKKLYIRITNILHLAILAMFFMNIWLTHMNAYMEQQFLNKGNILVLVVYVILLAAFFKVWGGFLIMRSKLVNLVISQILAILCANVLEYLQIVLMVGNISYIVSIAVQMLKVVIFDVIISVLLDYIFVNISIRLFPPYRVLQINGQYKNHLSQKIKARDDKYKICEEISVFDDKNKIFDKISCYDVVLLNDIPSENKNEILKFCFNHSIRVYFTPKISDIIVQGTSTLNIFDSPLFVCKNIGLTAEQKFIKRLMDVILSLIGIIITSPIMIVTAVCIKMHDGGPVLFKQKRCTYMGKEFWIYKFRSMIVDAEKEGVSRPATDGDDRITSVGRVIRKTRIDELQQLFNILKGDMSIVGPRPERVEHIEKYTAEIPEFSYRFKVKGGLTGYAQVYGKYNTTAYDKLKMDMLYIVNYSLLLDLQIIMETVKIIFQKESTEGFSEEQFNKIYQGKGEKDI